MYRKPRTKSELRANEAERADHGRTPPSKGRRRRPPNAWDDLVNEKSLRQWKLLRRWVAHHLRRKTPKAKALPLFLAKKEFEGMGREYFELFWRWAVEDAATERRRGKTK